ncbi:MSC_0620 family F1-like ATPase-associated subunit [Mycoplasmopsis adleri]|uniref:MSC_0620 family F1-like ATPase-associated subunit n=1 Tax=Mycoplasmopsis adleri TaxID=51362 RepID=UPI0038738696
MKINKKILSIGSLIPLAAPLAFVSTSPANNPNNNSEDPKPTVSPDFDTFKEKIDKVINEKLAEIITSAIEEIKEKAKSYHSADSTNKQDFVNEIYLYKVANYLENNKANILKNPSEWGFTIVYPRVISENREISAGSIKYGGETYSIVFGKTKGTSYSGKGFSEKVIDDTFENVETFEAIKSRTDSYFNDLKNQFMDIVANDYDIPQINPKDKQTIAELTYDDKTSSLKLEVPKGYESWEHYILNKINPRFTIFDLTNNQDQTQEQDDSQPLIPPLIPKEKPVDWFKEDNTILNINNLSPIIKFEYFDSLQNGKKDNYAAFIKEFNRNKSSATPIFFFDNPINTRFAYKVSTLKYDTASSKLKATVLIEDVINKGQQREYERELKVISSKAQSKSLEAAINYIQSIYAEFYKALGIGPEINLLKLADRQLSRAVYNMINNTVKLTSSQEYITAFNKLVKKYESSFKNSNTSPSVNNDKHYKTELLGLFLGGIKTLKTALNNP